MNCRHARAALSVGARGDELERHLLGCARCRALAVIDRRIDEARLRLLEQPPPLVDVRSRVLREIARLGSPHGRSEVRDWQLGLALAVALVIVVALGAAAWDSPASWRSASRGIEGSFQALMQIASAAGASTLAAGRVSLRVLAALQHGARPIADISARLEPAAVAGVSLSYVIMIGAILHVLRRDLRRIVRTGIEE